MLCPPKVKSSNTVLGTDLSRLSSPAAAERSKKAKTDNRALKRFHTRMIWQTGVLGPSCCSLRSAAVSSSYFLPRSLFYHSNSMTVLSVSSSLLPIWARHSKFLMCNLPSSFFLFQRSISISPNISSKPNAAETVRLSKRMSELDLCSRREADAYISQNRVYINGVRVAPILGQKVSKHEKDIRIDFDGKQHNLSETIQKDENDWERRRGDTIILHKPLGYVSGQPDTDHGHIPAVRLLTRANLHIPSHDKGDIIQTVSSGLLDFHRTSDTSSTTTALSTLVGYVPAGRLDLDSSGLLIFTKCGVVAKKLTSTLPFSRRVGKRHKNLQGVEKEYRVHVEPVQSITRYERDQLRLRGIPHPTKDLSVFIKGGRRLWNDPKPLKPLIAAEWLQERGQNNKVQNPSSSTVNGNWKGVLRLVLKEGKKHQIRRMCREILGLHVTKLVRVRIGNMEVEDLPEGKWRPLREHEFSMLLDPTPSMNKS